MNYLEHFKNMTHLNCPDTPKRRKKEKLRTSQHSEPLRLQIKQFLLSRVFVSSHPSCTVKPHNCKYNIHKHKILFVNQRFFYLQIQVDPPVFLESLSIRLDADRQQLCIIHTSSSVEPLELTVTSTALHHKCS